MSLPRVYETPPSPCSKQNFCIAGIQTIVYGVKELSAHPLATNVASLWFLHPRGLTKECMEPLAFSIVRAWNSYVERDRHTVNLPGLIGIAFDQRNHGSRDVDSLANADWKSGNKTHAQDMFSIFRLS